MTAVSKRVAESVPWALSAGIIIRKLGVPLYDSDLWWHLAAGREMVRRGAWLRTDVFSHTLAGAPWIDFEWLGQLLLYGLHQAGGVWAIYVGKIVFSLSALGLLTWTARRSGARGPALLAAAWAGFLLLRPRLFERTELATLNLLPLFVLLILKARSSEKMARILPWALAGLMALWVNLHAGFIYGMAALAAFAVGARWSGEGRGFVRALDRSFTWCLAALLVNPYGPKIFDMFLETFAGLRGGLVIDEWRPPSVQSVPVFWFFFLLGGAAAARGLLRGPRTARFWAPAVVVFAVLGSAYVRSTVLLSFFVIPFLAEEFVPRPWAGKALWAAVGTVLLVNAGALRRPFPRAPLFRDKVPSGACRFVRDQGIRGTLFNVYDEGGYLEWTLGPDRKAFIDGRYIFLPLLEEQTRILDEARLGVRGDLAWRGFMDRHGVDYAVTKPPFPGTVFPGPAPFPLRATNLMFPRDRWALVYWDDAGLVFLKRGAGFEALIAKHEYRWVWPYNMDQMRHVLGTGGSSREAVAAELDRHRAEAGPTAAEQEMRGLLAAVAGGKP